MEKNAAFVAGSEHTIPWSRFRVGREREIYMLIGERRNIYCVFCQCREPRSAIPEVPWARIGCRKWWYRLAVPTFDATSLKTLDKMLSWQRQIYKRTKQYLFETLYSLPCSTQSSVALTQMEHSQKRWRWKPSRDRTEVSDPNFDWFSLVVCVCPCSSSIFRCYRGHAYSTFLLHAQKSRSSIKRKKKWKRSTDSNGRMSPM